MTLLHVIAATILFVVLETVDEKKRVAAKQKHPNNEESP